MVTLKSLSRLFVVLFVVIFALTVAVVMTSAKPSGVPAVDGDGLMAVSPTTVTYGTSSATLVFTFTANADFGAGSQVEIDIPAGWTAPTTTLGAGRITWNTGTCSLNGNPPGAVTGMSIFIDLTSCPTNAFFNVTYANATPGPLSGSPYTFTTWSDIGAGGGGLTKITAGSPLVTITPKTLTVSATGLTPANKIYDSTTPTTLTIGSPTLVGVVGADSVLLVTTGETADFVDANASINKTVNIAGLTLSGAQAGNYTLVQPTRIATIFKRAITVAAVNDVKVYDAGVSSSGVPTITIGSLQGLDTALWDQTFNTRHAGISNKILTPAGSVNDGNGGNNYAVTFVAYNSGTITKKPITITAVSDSKVYDGSTSSSGVPQVAPALLGSDTPVFTQTFDTKNAGTGKTLTPTGLANDGNGGSDYAYTYISNTTGVILAATPGVAVTNSPVIYNGLAHAAVITSSVPGTISDIRYNSSATTPTNAGLYAVTAVFTPTDTLNYNSLLPGAAGSFVILKATPVLSVTNSPVTYDGLPHAAVVTTTVAGVISNIQYNGSTTIPAKAGNYAITADFTSSDPNYADLVGAPAGNFVIRALVYLPLILR